MKHYSHRNCTFILPNDNRGLSSIYTPKRTHGCWCSAWRLTRNGMRIWRRGAWRKAKPGELRQVKGHALERLRLMGYEWNGYT